MSADSHPVPSGESERLEIRPGEIVSFLLASADSYSGDTYRRVRAYAAHAHQTEGRLADARKELARLRTEVARLEAESEGRRAVLERKAEEVRQEWMRAEAAEAEAARYREAHAILAAFARTAPGCLPQRVQDAVNLAPWDGPLVRTLATEGGDRAE